MTRWVWGIVWLAGCGPQNVPPPERPPAVVAIEACAPSQTCAEEEEEASPPTPPFDTSIAALGWVVRDERKPPRVTTRALMVTEIANFERLFALTPKGDTDRPRLMRRLAESYIALESTARRDAIEANTKAKLVSDATLAAQHEKEARRSTKIAEAALKNAIKHYLRLTQQYPKWCMHPTRPVGARACADEALYYLGLGYERAGELEKARHAYLELSENWKQSKYLPLAYLAFGELFVAEASRGDTAKWTIAAEFFMEVLKFPPPDNRAWGYAALRLAQTRHAMGDTGTARQRISDVVDWATKYPSLPGAKHTASRAKKLSATW